MNKVAEFYAKAMADESTTAEFAEAMGGKAMSELGDAELEKLGKLAEKLGFTISIEEAKEYLKPKEGELADDELDAVAGGSDKYETNPKPVKEGNDNFCPWCGAKLRWNRDASLSCPDCSYDWVYTRR